MFLSQRKESQSQKIKNKKKSAFGSILSTSPQGTEEL